MSFIGSLATGAIGVVNPAAGMALGFGRKAVASVKTMPWQVWAGLAIAILLVVGFFVHRHDVKKALTAAYAHGASDEDAKWKKNLSTAHTAAIASEQKTAATEAQISQIDRSQHEQDIRTIASRADDQRLHGPGKSAAPADSGQGGHSAISTPSGGPKQTPPASDAGLDRLPSDTKLAVVPWNDLVTHAQQCDAERSEALIWRDWYSKQAAENEKARGSQSPAMGQ